ncbi:MAG: FAD-linked oxidase C-terminal domain-containing protein, partial [Pseudonocardia sp.]
IVFDPADGDAQVRAEAAFGEIFHAAMDLGGTITGEHGVGAAKRPWLAEMVDRIDAIAHAHDVPVATFGHAGDGNLHPTIVVDQHDDAAIKRAHEAFGEVFKAAIGMDGTITGEHGVGAAKLPYLIDKLGADQMALLRRIKAAFDPAGILNPGKLGS